MKNRTHAGILILVLAAGLVGCDGARAPGPSAPSPVQQPTPQPVPPSESSPFTQRVSDTATAAIGNPGNGGIWGFYQFDLSVPRSGTATLTLTWANADETLVLYLTTNTCANTASLVAGACTILAKSDGGNPPRVIRSSVTTGDAVKVWVLNYDNYSHNVTVDIGIK
ncbi:MAG: hypothetical protein ABIQ52_07930 [Vicinamibacterales bacterium]